MTVMLERATTGPVQIDGQGILEGRIVPWELDAEVVDHVDGRPDHYIEAWRRGAFDPQTKSTNAGTIRKVDFVDTHTDTGRVGYALAFEDRDDGQWGQFRILPRHLEDVSQMVTDGIDGLSIRFHPKANGVVSSWTGRLERRLRTAAHLIHVALVAEPAYVTARVMAMREAEEELIAERAALARTVEADEIIAGMVARADRWTHLA